MGASRPTFGSAFAGIGGFDLGLERAGWRCAWQIEIDRTCVRVLEDRWPDVRRYGDIREVDAAMLEHVDLLCGGFPCQDLSIAGRRAGLRGERSALFWEFVRLAEALQPSWLLIENVPGLLSSRGGRDMAAILGALEKLGYWWAYRTLDAQYFGVPQRRRRVFIVARLGDWAGPFHVLFEPSGRRRDSPPSRKAGKSAPAPSASGAGASRASRERTDVAHALTRPSSNARYDPNGETYVIQDASGRAKRQNGAGVSNRGVAYTLDSDVDAVAMRNPAVVRRLMPVECERLQGFPDGWTEGLSDSARYRALGNAVAVPVAEWLGRRIRLVHEGRRADEERTDLRAYADGRRRVR